MSKVTLDQLTQLILIKQLLHHGTHLGLLNFTKKCSKFVSSNLC